MLRRSWLTMLIGLKRYFVFAEAVLSSERTRSALGVNEV